MQEAEELNGKRKEKSTTPEAILKIVKWNPKYSILKCEKQSQREKQIERLTK